MKAVALMDQTTTSGDDYAALTGAGLDATFTGADEDSTATITLMITQDVDIEDTEELQVSIQSVTDPANNVIGELSKAVVCILDDDKPSEFTFIH